MSALDVSPYLNVPSRGLRCACLALRRHRLHRPRCDLCPLSDLCLKSSGLAPGQRLLSALAAKPREAGPDATEANGRSRLEWRFVTGSVPPRGSSLWLMQAMARPLPTGQDCKSTITPDECEPDCLPARAA